ncbi:hypothetical protein QN277_022431 [Acacia crassicarpa]|uniref:LOB domain-containing protein n=1 Tax=Acacia crassicarpa TaxID=499986 RepID=A0AAE1MQN8_9FABA|nr:hypothetical protein QN277_022431 [Acacia crassicarpa]
MNLFQNSDTNLNHDDKKACAACKYRRRKCAPDCILAPYFPHDRHSQFLNAHKLFGVRNITKIIEKLDPYPKDEAMRSIIFQSDMRANDPVGGCCIQELVAQIEYHRAELDLVLQQLAVFRPHQSPNINTSVNADDHHLNNDDVNSWDGQESLFLSFGDDDESNADDVGDELYDDQKPMASMLDINCDELVKRSDDEVILFKIENAEVNGEVNSTQKVQDHDQKVRQPCLRSQIVLNEKLYNTF